jgi:hypothetical protein
MISTQSKPILVVCPGCEAELQIEPADQCEGRLLRCLQCGAELALTREWDPTTANHHWLLVDPQTEYDDEPN